VKALLMLAVLLAGIWLWRQRGAQAKPPRPTKTPIQQDMLRCHQCGMHIPSSEAIEGQLGSYCCAEHLRLSEP